MMNFGLRKKEEEKEVKIGKVESDKEKKNIGRDLLRKKVEEKIILMIYYYMKKVRGIRMEDIKNLLKDMK